MHKIVLWLFLLILSGVAPGAETAATTPPLPAGTYPEWNLDKAWRISSPAREEICINGLWRFHSVSETIAFEDCFEHPSMTDWNTIKVFADRGSWQVTQDKDIKKSGSGALRLDFNLKPGKDKDRSQLYRRIPVEPDTVYILTADLRSVFIADTALKENKPERGMDDEGSHADRSARGVYLMIQDGEQWTADKPVINSNLIAANSEWGQAKIKFRTGKDIRSIRVYLCTSAPAMIPLQGKIWMDNLILTAPVKIVPPEKLEWGYVKVPESWNPSAFMNVNDPAKNKRKYEIDDAWYEREITIPSGWNNRRITISFDRIASDATLFCNGQPAGHAGYLGGEIDITRLVHPGDVVKLDVLVRVQSAPDTIGILAGRLKDLWNDPNYMFRWLYRMRDRGLLGDVFLKSEPLNPPKLTSFLIETTVKTRQIKVYAQLDNNGNGGALQLHCLIKDGDRVVKDFSGQVAGGAISAEASALWADPVLWDVGTPKLYTMTVELLDGTKLADCSLPQTFGFREFEIRERDFYLNGIKLHLFPDMLDSLPGTGLQTPEMLERWIDRAMQDHKNFVYIETLEIPGGKGWLRTFLEIADRKGMLVAVTPQQINFFWEQFDRPEIRMEWEKNTATFVRKYWNHPSLVLWRMNMNMDHYNQDQNPLLLDGSLVPAPDSEKGRKAVVMDKSNAFVEKLDPTRKTYNHASANFSNIYSLNNYLNWPQPQDLREWLRIWAEKGRKPLMMAEFDLPYAGSFEINDQTSWGANEPVMTEYAAIMLGEDSYKLEQEEFTEFCDLAWDRKNRKWLSCLEYFANAYPPLLDEVGAAYFRIVYPAWRTWGISGGMVAWDDRKIRMTKKRPGGIGMRQYPPMTTITRNDWGKAQKPGYNSDFLIYPTNSNLDYFHFDHPLEKEFFGQPTTRGQLGPELICPLYAYLAGPGRDWPGQDHTFYAGEKVAKSAVLINDRRYPVEFAVNWQAALDGRMIASGQGRQTVPPAENRQVELEFTVPAVAEKCPITITAAVTADGKPVPAAPLTILAYPPRSPLNIKTDGWYLCDPPGKTAAALQRLGLTPQPLPAGAAVPDDAAVLLFGAGALDNAAAMRLFKTAADRVKGGMQMVIFEQSAVTLEKGFGLRSTVRAARQVWLRDRHSPVTSSLDNEELRDWRGSTSLEPPGYLPKDADESQRYRGVWRCSSRGTVSSVLVEKPQAGSFRPLLDCEFDLRYTPLWEVFEDRGRLLFCQLDVSGRIGVDPAVDRLMTNLLRDVSCWLPHPAATVTVIGEDAMALSDLAALNISAKINPDVCPSSGAGHILVLTRGGDKWLDAHASELAAFLRSGGQAAAVGLNCKMAARLAEIAGGFDVETVKNLSINRLNHDVPAVFRGIGPAEVHWREKKEIAVVKTVAAGGWRSPTGVLAWIPAGKGGIVWTSVLPSDFSPKQRPDLVFTHANVSRLLAVILTNLGAPVRSSWAAEVNANYFDLPVSLEKEWKAELDPNNQGLTKGWQQPQFSDRSWHNVGVPGYFENKVPAWAKYDGVIWYRTTFKLASSLRQVPLEFFAGAIDDFDEVYVNGVKVGSTDKSTPKWWSVPRHYPLPENLLKFGDDENSIAVKITDKSEFGGFIGAVQIQAVNQSRTQHYLDQRVQRDDPYAYGRW